VKLTLCAGSTGLCTASSWAILSAHSHPSLHTGRWGAACFLWLQVTSHFIPEAGFAHIRITSYGQWARLRFWSWANEAQFTRYWGHSLDFEDLWLCYPWIATLVSVFAQ